MEQLPQTGSYIIQFNLCTDCFTAPSMRQADSNQSGCKMTQWLTLTLRIGVFFPRDSTIRVNNTVVCYKTLNAENVSVYTPLDKSIKENYSEIKLIFIFFWDGLLAWDRYPLGRISPGTDIPWDGYPLGRISPRMDIPWDRLHLSQPTGSPGSIRGLWWEVWIFIAY